jgi:3-phosphoglycerate kinase
MMLAARRTIQEHLLRRTVAALAAAGVAGDLTYVSTAGSAFLEWLDGRELQRVKALATG